MKYTYCLKIAIITIISFLGLINSGNIIPDPQNPVLVYLPNINNSPRIDVRFQLDVNSAGLVYGQYMALVFPPNVLSDLQFDQGTSLKYSCALTDGTTTYTLTADKPISSTEGNIAYCKLSDITNNLLRGGNKYNYKFSLTLATGTKITSNYVRSLKLFTSTSNKLSKIIIDQLSFVGNVALYSDPVTSSTKAIDITSSSILMGSTTVTNIYPYQTFDIALNIKSNIFISASDLVFTFRFNKNYVYPAQSAISNSLNLGTTIDPLSNAIKGSLTLTTFATGDTVLLSGITEDLIPNRQFQIVLKSWKALDLNTNSQSPLEMMVYYKNTYSLISYVVASTNFFKISYATVTLTAGHPDGWDIFRNGVFPMRLTFTSAQDLTNGGFVLIQQSNTQDLISRFNFVAATCDFSENDNNFDQGFGKRPQCYPIRTDMNYVATPSTGYPGSGIFFYVKSLQANKVYYVTVWGSADACGGSALSNFGAAITANTGTSTQFNFQLTVYNGINANAINEARFTGKPILGQSVSQTMANKCWNSMSQIMGAMDTTTAKNSISLLPFQDAANIQRSILVTPSTAGAPFCDPTNAVPTCNLINDISLYREFYNFQLINSSSAYTASSYFTDITTNTAGNTENFIYGSNVVSTNSYLGFKTTIPFLSTAKVLEAIPSPVAYDTTLSKYRAIPGRLELKLQKAWFGAGDTATATTPGCYMGWATNAQNTGSANKLGEVAMYDMTNAGTCPLIKGQSTYISSFVNAACVGGTQSTVPMLDTTNSLLPSSTSTNTYSHYKILSVWNGQGLTATAVTTTDPGTGYAGNSHFGFPVKTIYNNSITAVSAFSNLEFGVYTTCLKWNPPTTIKSLYTSIDIQLNWLFSTDSATITGVPNRAMRFIKLFPEGGVFQDISTNSATRILSTAVQDQNAAGTRSYKLHYATGLNNSNLGVCLIEIYGAGLQSTSDSSSPVLAIWIGFGVILEQDYNDLSSNYPVAPLANASYASYGLQSGRIMNIKENFNVHLNFEGPAMATTTHTNNLTGADAVAADFINRLPLRNLLMNYAYTGFNGDPAFGAAGTPAAYSTGTEALDATKTTYALRSSYLFFMGSLVLVTGITSNSITTTTTSSVVNNLLIPIYCPIHDTTNNVSHQYNGIPTLYMAFLSMTAFNSITSVNRIYAHKNSTPTSFTVLTSAIQNSQNYYRTNATPTTVDQFINAKLSTDSTNYLNYLFTLRWAPYTSVITNSDNILYLYYYNTNTAPSTTNQNCTGHVLLFNTSLITIDSTNITKVGITGGDPALFNGTKNFYYLGYKFNKSIAIGLGNTNPGATTTYSTGAISTQNLNLETSAYYVTGIKRPSVESFYQNGVYSSPFNNIAYFCSSAQQYTTEMFSNYLFYPASLLRSFIIDFNPPVSSTKTFVVSVNQDKTETIFKNDIAGNTKLIVTLPAKIPGGTSIRFFANANAFNSNTICGIVNGASQPVSECTSPTSSIISCPTVRSDSVYTICCYNVSINSDTFSLSSLYVSIPAAPNTDQSTRFNTEKLYDAATQISTTPISWSTGQSTGTDVIGTQFGKINKVEYQQVIQDSGIGKIIITLTLPREPTRNMAVSITGDLSGMLIQNNTPRCVATFGNVLGANWDSSGDVLIDTCDVTNFSGSTAPIVITTKNLVYKCGLSFASKSVTVMLWPVVVLNWANNPYSSNNYKVTMALNNSSSDAIALNSSSFNIASNLVYLAKPGFTGQWDTLCTISSVVPKIPGEYADYQFDFDLDTNKSALSNSAPNEVSIFFPYVHYGATVSGVLCFYNNALLNCSFTDEGILNIRFSSVLPVGSGKKISITITGIYNPSFESEIYFPCTVNTTNFSSGVRQNLITGSGKLTGGIPIPTTTVQGALRYINPNLVTDVNPRNVSTHTFRITFDSAINLSPAPITISNTPQIIITFPIDYNLAWYNNVKATASIDEYTSDTNNLVTKTSSISPATVNQSGNRVTIILPAVSYTFSTNWRYWEVKISNITGPTDTSSGSSNGTTGPYSIILTNSNYSSIYRVHQNLNNSAYNNMNTQADSWIQFNRGVEFKFDNNKWVIDINTSGVFNIITIRPGRFISSTFTIKSNTSASIQPRAATITLNDQIFRLADTSYPIITSTFQPVIFYIGAPCGTAPGSYLVNFSLTGDTVTSFFAPLAPVQITVDTSNTGLANFSIPTAIPAGASTLIYITLSEPNVDTLNVSWAATDGNKNDATAQLTNLAIAGAVVKAGTTYTANNSLYSVFSITNLQATNNQVFKPNALNACYNWSSSTITFTIFGTQAIIPNQYDFTPSFKYFNSDTDSTLTIKNAIKLTFTPPYSPIYVYCALVCFNRNYPTDDVIKTSTNVNADNLTRYYMAMFNNKTPSDIVFDNLVRGQRYKLRCIISSTEGNPTLRTSTSVNIEQMSTTNGTSTLLMPSAVTKTQCVQYYFTSDPGQATKIAMVNYCQKLFSSSGWSQSGCIICADSGLTYTSPGLALPTNITCSSTASKSKLRFLQTSTTTAVANNTTVITPTSAGTTVNPSGVNQSNPITFSICPLQHPICPTDVSGNKLYSDYFSQLITDTKSTLLFNTNLGIVNVPVNNTLIVNDNVAPDISKNFVSQIISANPNGLVQFSASFPSAINCSWQIAESSLAPASGALINQCVDSQWCGKGFYVGTLTVTSSTNSNNLKAFTSGKSYSLYLACSNDVPYSSSISNVVALPLNLPASTVVTPTTITNTSTTNTTVVVSSSYTVFNYAIILLLAFLI